MGSVIAAEPIFLPNNFNQPLKTNRYLTNNAAHGTTTRVLFIIEDKSGKLKIPSLQKLRDFLKK